MVIGQDAPRYIHQFLLARYNDPHLPQWIADLHGIYRHPDNIILSSNDYTETYGLYVEEDNKTEGSNRSDIKEEWTLHRKFCGQFLATRRVVFCRF